MFVWSRLKITITVLHVERARGLIEPMVNIELLSPTEQQKMEFSTQSARVTSPTVASYLHTFSFM
jgi:hypothetical protein